MLVALGLTVEALLSEDDHNVLRARVILEYNALSWISAKMLPTLMLGLFHGQFLLKDLRAPGHHFARHFHGGAHRVLYFWHALGNRAITTLCNMVTNLNLMDMEVGYKAFRADVLRQISIRSDRFGFEPEITIKIAKLGCRIYEVPISYHGRTYAEGKKIGWRDGFAAFVHILRFRFFE